MDKIKSTQKDVRDKRDQMFRERGDIKKKEDDFKAETRYNY
jgi:hypothetical protein